MSSNNDDDNSDTAPVDISEEEDENTLGDETLDTVAGV